jgi:hypothetical protein
MKLKKFLVATLAGMLIFSSVPMNKTVYADDVTTGTPTIHYIADEFFSRVAFFWKGRGKNNTELKSETLQLLLVLFFYF